MATKLEFTRDQLAKLAERHITRFNRLIASGGRNVRVAECQRYLAIWQDIQDTVRAYPEDTIPVMEAFKRNEKQEIVDAYNSEGFIDILGRVPDGP